MQICGFCKKEIDLKDLRKGFLSDNENVQRISSGTYMYSCPHCHAMLAIASV